LLRILQRIECEPKNFFAEIGLAPWLGVVAQRGTDPKPDSHAEEILFFEF
jgi:hypothetical protein